MITYTFEDGTTMRIDPLVVSQRIKSVLEEKNISLQELSDLTGIAKSSLQRYSSGATDKIPMDRICKIASKTHTSVFYLLGQTDKMEEETDFRPTDYIISIPKSDNKDDSMMVLIERMTPGEKIELAKYAEFLLSKRRD